MRKVIDVGLGIATLAVALIVGVPTWDEPGLKADALGRKRLGTALTSQLSVVDAVTIAKERTGGEVLEASYYYLPLRSASVYALKTYQNSTLWEAMVDANSGQILGVEETTPRDTLDLEDKAEISGVQTASISITKAIQIAERHTGGKVIAVDLEAVGAGGVFWEVTVVTDGTIRKLLIDPVLSKWTQTPPEAGIRS
jgi:uncharacterized membrane protein YkoI